MQCWKCEKKAPFWTLYRVNAKGKQPAIWSCNSHRIEPDAELDCIIDYIEKKGPVPNAN